ncbi:MAG: STAS/SEC14 domain-containing protein [Gemmataceae bacterium]
MIELLNDMPVNSIGFQLSGKLHDGDYKTFVPLVDEEIAKAGTVNILVKFHDFHGWDLHALWDDIQFATTHCTKITRVAMVGEITWQDWMAMVCKPFTMAKVRYFEVSEFEAAKTWLAEKE